MNRLCLENLWDKFQRRSHYSKNMITLVSSRLKEYFIMIFADDYYCKLRTIIRMIDLRYDIFPLDQATMNGLGLS